MKVSFSHYPKPFQAAINTLKGYRTKPDLVISALSHLPGKRVNLGLEPSCRAIEKEEILKSDIMWLRAFLSPCFLIGAAVKNKEGMVDRVAAGHFGARFTSSELEGLLSRILPIAPDEKVNAFIAGSSQRITEEMVMKNMNDIVNEFKKIGLPLKAKTDIWHLPVLSDINMNNMVISDLGNKKREKYLTRMAYFGITPEDCMLFCTHRIGERIQRIRIITPDVGPIDL